MSYRLPFISETKKCTFILLPIILIILLAGCKTDDSLKTEVSESANQHSKGLNELTSIPIGGAISINKVLADEKLKEITINNFNSITATNDMKMYSILRDSIYNFKKVDKLLAFCEENNKRLFGHTLLWHHGLPEWIKKEAAKNGSNSVDQFMKDYITKVVSRYKGKVPAWDVVNEGFESSGGAYRETFWYKHLGKAYIEKAFRYAHAADPKAMLFYNDFNIERDTAKLNGVLQMIDELKRKGVPIHGLGFQMHLRIDIPDEVIASSLKKAAATGLKIHISELDIIFNNHNDGQDGGKQQYAILTEEMKNQQAEKYKKLVIMYRKYIPAAQQFGITFWDFNDRDTWIRPFFKIMDWPTIYDENLDPKPAYHGFAEGLQSKIPES